ncbi:YoaK family protein [Kitasatospora paranensis]|uniref:YoaK family protein n=1 Tax=Kitasatospora paranensis TaxID=258053 RepID=A0ABW2FXY6_9ACTN
MTPTLHRPDPQTAALLLLTVVTGVVEAVSFLGLGKVFTAVMTGNVLFLGFGLAGEDLSIIGSGIALLAFAVGAFGGHWTNLWLVRRRGARWAPIAVTGVGVLLVAAALAALGLDRQASSPSGRDLAVISVLSAAMGWRNATTLRIAAPGLPTTVVTRGLTGLLRVHAALDARGRALAAAVAMLFGAAVGALLLDAGLTVPLLVAAATELGAGAVFAATGGVPVEE